MYIARRIGEVVGIQAFIADGTFRPIFFHFYEHWIKPVDISSEKIHQFWGYYVEEAEEWRYQDLIKLIFNKETVIWKRL